MALNKIQGLHNNIIIKIALILIAFTFIWSLSDFSNFTGDNYIAKIGNKTIGAQEYKRAYDNIMQKYGSSFAGISQDELSKLGIDKIVLSNLINDKMKDNLVADMGLKVSDTKIAQLVRENPEFFTNGAFDINKFNNALNSNGLSEKDFIIMSKENIGKSILYNGLSNNLVSNHYLANVLYDYYFEKKYFDVFEITSKNNAENPSAEELEKFYNLNKTKYIEPEKRAIKFIEITNHDVRREIKITDTEIEEYYNLNIDQFIKPEARDFISVSFSSEQEAEKFTGQTKNNLLANKQLVTKEYKSVPKTSLQGEVQNMVFNTPINSLSKPFQVENKFWIVVPTKIEAPVKTTIEQARKIIIEAITKDKQTNNLIENISKIEDEISGGSELSDIASKYNYKIQNATISKDNSIFPNKFVEDLFKSETKETEFFASNDKHYLYQIENIIPEKAQELATIHNIVIADYKQSKSQEELENFVNLFSKSLADNNDRNILTNNFQYNIKTYANLQLTRTDLMNDFSLSNIPNELTKIISSSNDNLIIKEINKKFYITKITKTEIPAKINQDQLKFIENKLDNDFDYILDQEILQYLSTLYKVKISSQFGN